MKNVIAIVILCAAAISAPAADEKNNTAPQPLTIPKEAVLNPDGRTYAYTDKQGKKWIYNNTPFGVVKSPARDKPASAPKESISTKVIDKGDTVTFERPTPFGTVKWEKKKSELTDEERRLLDSQKLDAQTAKTEQK